MSRKDSTKDNTALGRSLILCVLLSLGALSLAACEQPRWDDPAYVSQQLESADATTRKVAMGKIEGLKEDQRKALVPALTKIYLEKDSNQKDVMKMLVQQRDPAAKDAYLEEVKSNATGYAGAAAEALGDAKIKEAVPDMVKLLETTDSNDTKQGLLRGMAAMPDEQMIPALIKLLQMNSDDDGAIPLQSYACDILGDIAQAKPQALDAAAIKTLTKGVFLSNTLHQDVSKECGLALQKLGQPAVADLLTIFKGERDDLKLLMSTYKFPLNRPVGVAATRLTGMRAKEAGQPFVDALNAPVQIPESLRSQEDRLGWIQTQVQVFHEIILGLGDIGVAESVPTLTKILLGEKNKDYSSLLDYTTETQLRQDAAEALNRVGDRAAAASLLKAAKDGVIEDLEKLAKAQEAKGAPVPANQRYSFNITSAKAFVNLAGADAEAGLTSLIDAAKNDELKKELGMFSPMIATFKECDAKGDDKAKAACYGAKLKDQNVLVREKAVYELSRLSTEAAAPVLNENLGTTFMDTRELIIWAVYRHPNKDAITKIDAILTAEEGQRDKSMKLAAYLQKLLRAWLHNNAK